jgi:hypothetical protein
MAAKVAADLRQQSFEPVTLAGLGALWTPSAILETVGETVADIGNGGLKTAPIITRASGQQEPAVGAAIAAHEDWLSAAVEVPGGKPMSPDATATARAPIRFAPGKMSTALKDALDAGFNEKYQWRCFRECHSHLPGAEGAATPSAPTPFRSQNNWTIRLFSSSHCEKSTRLSGQIF